MFLRLQMVVSSFGPILPSPSLFASVRIPSETTFNPRTCALFRYHLALVCTFTRVLGITVFMCARNTHQPLFSPGKGRCTPGFPPVGQTSSKCFLKCLSSVVDIDDKFGALLLRACTTYCALRANNRILFQLCLFHVQINANGCDDRLPHIFSFNVFSHEQHTSERTVIC